MIKQPEEKISSADKWFIRVLACAAYLILAVILDQYIHQEVSLFGLPDGYLQDRIGITDNILTVGFGLLCLALIFPGVCSLLLKTARSFFRLAQKLGKTGLFFYLVAALLYAVVVFRTQQSFSKEFFLRGPFLLGATLLGAAALKKMRPGQNRYALILIPFLLLIVLYRFVNYAPGITTYPLSLGWSETSNFFYASQFLAQKIYGAASPLPLINPGRALVSIFPFLLPHPQIWINRLWEAMLWAGMTTLTAVLITRRLKLSGLVQNVGLAAWIILFLYQGPIYYDVLMSVCLVIWLFNAQHFWRSMLVVVVASAWVGICRLNWFPMPGVLAGLMYILEQPKEQKKWINYLARPAAWAAVGLVVAFASMTFYAAISGNSTSDNSTVLSEPLLWYRLLPNATYSWGILPAALVTAFPAVFLVGVFLTRQRRHWDPWRILIIVAILVVFFLGGLIVSIKIGGGGDLHNLDAFWFLLALLCGYLYFQRFTPDRPETAAPAHIPAIILVLLVVLPVGFQFTQPSFFTPPQQDLADQAISSIRKQVSTALNKGKPVLFMTEKQLITFGQLPGTPMVFDYEKVYMLDWAMSDSMDQLNNFYRDLKDNHFGLIIIDPQPGLLKPQNAFFSDEHNAQVSRIGRYLDCYTSVVTTWLSVGLQSREPRLVTVGCP